MQDSLIRELKGGIWPSQRVSPTGGAGFAVGKRFRLGGFGVPHDDVAVEPAAWRPATFYGCTSRLYDRNKVVHDSIGDGFVKDPFIAEPLQVHFEAFQLDAKLVWNVGKDDLPVIGLSRFGADRCKFGAMMFDGIVAIAAGVFKYFQRVAKIS